MGSWKCFLGTSIKSLREQRRVWRGIFMRPMMNVEGILTWSGTSVTYDMQINLIRWRRVWQGWSCIERVKLPLSGTMLLLLAKEFFKLCFLHGLVTKDCGRWWCLISWGKCGYPSITPEIPNDESSCTIEKVNYFVIKKVIVIIIIIRWSMRITQKWWCHTPTHPCPWFKGKHSTGW